MIVSTPLAAFAGPVLPGGPSPAALSCDVQAVLVVVAWYLSVSAWRHPPVDRKRAGIVLFLLALFGLLKPQAHPENVDWLDVFLWPVAVPLLVWSVGALLGRDRESYQLDCTEPGSTAFSHSMYFCYGAILMAHSLTHPVHVYLGVVPCVAVRILITGPCWALIVLADIITFDELRHAPIFSLRRLARSVPVVRALVHPSFGLFGLFECFN